MKKGLCLCKCNILRVFRADINGVFTFFSERKYSLIRKPLFCPYFVPLKKSLFMSFFGQEHGKIRFTNIHCAETQTRRSVCLQKKILGISFRKQVYWLAFFVPIISESIIAKGINEANPLPPPPPRLLLDSFLLLKFLKILYFSDFRKHQKNLLPVRFGVLVKRVCRKGHANHPSKYGKVLRLKILQFHPAAIN